MEARELLDLRRSSGFSPRGQTAVRLVIAQCAAASGGDSAVQFALRNWGERDAATMILKSAVGGMSLSSSNALYGVAMTEFVDLVRPATLIGRLPGLRRVPLGIRVTTESAGAGVGWVREGAAIPLGIIRFVTATLDVCKQGAIVVQTKELATFSDPLAEDLIRNDLAKRVVAFSDAAFADPSVAAVAGQNPASITAGVSAITSTGNPSKDLAALIAAPFAGDLSASYILTDPLTAGQMNAYRDTSGTGPCPHVGPRGGFVLGDASSGIPVLTSSAVPRPSGTTGFLILVDPSAVVVGDGGIELDLATAATLQMDNAPTNTPTGLASSPNAPIATNMVSLYQANAVGVRCIRMINWLKARTNAVAVVSGAAYTPT